MHKRNEMMDRPVVSEEVRDFLRTAQKQLKGTLGEIEKEANEKRVPVIPHETVTFFVWLFGQIKPKEVLEIGTAIGFSAGLMAEYMDEEGKITTIDRNPTMIEKAKANFKTLEIEDKVTLLEGQANEWLEKLDDSKYDFIFMDSAKAKYYDFFPECMRVLKQNGVLAVDDVLQGGTILEEDSEIPRRRRKIHKKLNAFLEIVMDHPALDTTLLPLGDGLLLITKKEDFDFSFMKTQVTEDKS
ncbi:O-methyltransferase [Marinilactibacillus piezotolerans]|uniref:O-methyltransferase n=1 Tax=Marinilactibacillus piezotolerans TaxID=258723 RepID=UPI0009AF38F3|nr:O-methyltransferase [Marinilactibacillus piezotolerans]